jgi:hypothetical protein
MWWYTDIIPALGRLRQEDLGFEASMGLQTETSQITTTTTATTKTHYKKYPPQNKPHILL